ncbi:MAG: ABC transporter, permease protein 2 (cluster 1, maltose/g3p/polyamine/iron), partial [uncultured Arthrobacter sp.]
VSERSGESHHPAGAAGPCPQVRARRHQRTAARPAHCGRRRRRDRLPDAVPDHAGRLPQDPAGNPAGAAAVLPAGRPAAGELRVDVVDARDPPAVQPHLNTDHLGLRYAARAARCDPGGVLHGPLPLPGKDRVPVPRHRDADVAAGGPHCRAVPPDACPRHQRHLAGDDPHQRGLQPVLRAVDHAQLLRRHSQGDRRGGPARRRRPAQGALHGEPAPCLARHRHGDHLHLRLFLERVRRVPGDHVHCRKPAAVGGADQVHRSVRHELAVRVWHLDRGDHSRDHPLRAHREAADRRADRGSRQV